MRTARLLPLLPALALLAACNAGCSSSGSGGRVEGTVTHNGSPVEGAKVTYFAVVSDESKGVPAFTAVTDKSGRYRLPAGPKAPPLPPGQYKVTVVKFVAQKGAVLPPDADAEQLEASGLAANALPEEYAEVSTTPKTVEVKAGDNKIDVPVAAKQ